MTSADALKIRQDRRARKRMIRGRVIGYSVALFMVVWAVIAVVLVTGHDPALSRTKTTSPAASTSAATTSGESDSSGSSDTAGSSSSGFSNSTGSSGSTASTGSTGSSSSGSVTPLTSSQS